ncbi:hypothetical protein THIOSC13_570014 [uncultured Thiomicrorhabdus sp.]
MTTETQNDVIDPHAQREAEKYDNPIPSRELITQTLEEEAKPLRLFEIAKVLQVEEEDEERFEALSRRLKAMVRDGQLVRNRRGAFGLLKKMDLVRGRVLGHPDGFGFVVPDEGGKDLFYLKKRCIKCFTVTVLLHRLLVKTVAVVKKAVLSSYRTLNR